MIPLVGTGYRLYLQAMTALRQAVDRNVDRTDRPSVCAGGDAVPHATSGPRQAHRAGAIGVDRAWRPPWCDNLPVTKAELHELIDALPEGSLDGAAVLLRGIIQGPIDPDQAWFWTPAWQAGEREADEQLASGQGVVHHSTEELIAHLDASAAAGSGRRAGSRA
jgi:hypothetical protein